jgi:hypothetical protein
MNLKQTESLNLNLIESTDPVDWTPLNANMETLEAELGHIGHNLRVETGSYVGTGTYGRTDLNSLTFELYPVVVMIACTSSGIATPPFTMLRDAPGSIFLAGANTATAIYVTWEDHTVSWWCGTNAYYQANAENATFSYIALGY